MKKLAILLSALQICSLLTACSGGSESTETQATAAVTETTAAVESETTELTEKEKRALVEDGLPADKKYGGEKFTIISLENRRELYIAEEQTGVMIEDAIYSRNTAVEERFDVNIDLIGYADRHACRGAIQQAIRANDSDMFDLVAYHLADNGANAVSGLYLNWRDIPYVDFDKPWWADSNTEDLTINGKCFVALGDVSITSIRNIWCYILNKDMAADAQVGDLYQMVRNGEWTVDRVREIAQAVYADTNGDGAANAGDTFGLGSYKGSAMNTYLWAFDNPIIKKDETGVPQYVLNTEKFPGIVETVVDLYNNVKGVYACTAPDTTSYQTEFKSGNILMITGAFVDMTTFSSEVDFDCGVLPFPKYNEEQEKYYTMVDGGGDSLGLTVITEDTEFAGIITEALCAESYKQIYPVYYDMMLKNRYADMPDDAEMMDILVEGRVYDLGYIYDNWKGAGFWMQNLVNANNTAVASHYASNWPAAEKYYNTVLNLFEK